MTELILAAVILYQLHRLGTPGAPMTLLARLGMLGVALCIFRLIARIMT